MFRPRVIPTLLLRKNGLVKSVRFKNHRYIGDPINAVRIFNDKRADELVFLDITATKENRHISLEFVRKVGEEANMPFAVGGGIKTVSDIRKILKCGAEKVILNTVAIEKPDFIREASEAFGASTIVVCIDIKKSFFGKNLVVCRNGKKKSKESPLVFAKKMVEAGAGEIIVQAVDRDGTYQGYDADLIHSIASAVSIPVVALGGAKDYNDFREAVSVNNASAVSAGSLFVYHGTKRAVLINFPQKEELKEIFSIK